MKDLKYIFTLLLITIFTYVSSQKVIIPKAHEVDSVFSDWTDESKPGIAVGILNKGKLEFNKAWGLANVEHKVSISNSTVFKFPGMSEQILTVCILLLEERGKLNLNTKVDELLPWDIDYFSNITLLDLIQHTTGMQPIYQLKEISGLQDTDPTQEAEFLSLLELDLAYNAEEIGAHNYNRSGMRLLQMVLEQQTGVSYSEFAEKEIFGPLGMSSSQIASDNTLIPNKAQGYSNAGEQFALANQPVNYLICDEVYTTTKDICIWVDNFWRPQIGSKELWAKLDHFVLDKGVPVAKKNRSLFMGQHRYWDYRGEAKYYQIGISEGYAAKMIRYPEHDLAVVVLGNFDQYNGHLATICSDLYLNEYFNNNQKVVNKPNFLENPQEDLNQYCGSYWDYKGESKAVVSLENDTLRYYEEKYNWKTNLIALSEGKFYIDVRNGFHVCFEQNGKINTLRLSIPQEEDVVFTKFSAYGKWADDALAYEASYSNEELLATYKIKKHKKGLELTHSRKESILFKPMGKDAFSSNNSLINRIEFTRSNAGKVVALKLSNANFKDLYFKRNNIEVQ